jgi:hypothetical protein
VFPLGAQSYNFVQKIDNVVAGREGVIRGFRAKE